LAHGLPAFQTTAKLGTVQFLTYSYKCNELSFVTALFDLERLFADKISWWGRWEYSRSWSCSCLLSLGPFG